MVLPRADDPDLSAWDRPIRRIAEHPLAPADRAVWPGGVPAVRHLLDHGLELGPATVLVGANGVGKSTIVEAVAEAFGLNAEGGTRNVRHETRRTSSDLAGHLLLERGAGAPRGGVFLRAESMYGLFTHLEGIDPRRTLHERSHGEAFLEFCRERASVRGLWILDEPGMAETAYDDLPLVQHHRRFLAAPERYLRHLV